jgi:methylglutaconyl-CoA hydratase
MSNLQYDVRDRIAFITMNRPEKRNALNAGLISELTDAFDRAEEDNTVKVIVLRANGPAFCAGADLAYLQQLQSNSYEENLVDSGKLRDLLLKIYTLSKVVIAQVHGHAIAGGTGLTNACDYSFAVPEAKFGYTEVRLGFMPAIVMVFLIRKIGDQKARQLLLSGELITAQQALDVGIITRVVEAGALVSEVETFALQLIKNNSAESLAMTKRMMAEVQGMSLRDALQLAAEMNAKSRGTEDFKKGVASFLERKDLSW